MVRHFAYFCIFVISNLIDCGSACAQSNQEALVWQQAAKDLALAEAKVWPHSFFSPKLLLVRTKLSQYRLAVIRASDYGFRNSTVEALCEKSGAVLCINANFFDEKGAALGLVVSRGMQYHPMHRRGLTLTGVLQLTRQGPAIIHRDDYNSQQVIEAIQAGPRLMSKRHVLVSRSNNATHNRRAGVCLDGSKRLIFFITSGFIGASAEQLGDLLGHADIGCVDALNLDGGGSAQLYINLGLIADKKELQPIYLPGSDRVPVALGLFPASS